MNLLKMKWHQEYNIIVAGIFGFQLGRHKRDGTFFGYKTKRFYQIQEWKLEMEKNDTN